ncbi:hypothetical protein, partial [Senegalimassilia anaerobia]
MMERRFISYETNALSGRALCTLANFHSWAAVGCPAARAGKVRSFVHDTAWWLVRWSFARPGRRGYGGFKTETALVWRAGFRLPYALADRKTKNAPEWFEPHPKS